MNKRVVLVGVGATLLFVVLPISLLVIHLHTILFFTPHGSVKFTTIPSPVRTIIQSRTVTVNQHQNILVPIGQQTFIISSPGFSTQRKVVTVNKDKSTTLTVILKPLTDDAKKAVNDPKYQPILQEISAINREPEINNLRTENPILKYLPITDNSYTITPCQQDINGKISLCIASFIPGTDYMQQAALNKITSLGYKLSDYKIIIDGVPYN